MAGLFGKESGGDVDCTPVTPPPEEEVINVKITNPEEIPTGGGGSDDGVGVSSVNGLSGTDGALMLDSDDVDQGSVNFYVTPATVNAAGATMESDTNVGSNGWVLDDDSMAGNDDTKVPTQQSVKAYVDAQVGGGGGATNLDWNAVSSIVSSDTGTDATLTVVDGSNPGLMTSSDKSKLDAITGTNTGDNAYATTSVSGIVVIAGPVATDLGVDTSAVVVPAGLANMQSDIAANNAKVTYPSADSTKLSLIEDNADVTDSTNVDAAGAVMETDTSTAEMGFVNDEDDMASNSDTKVPTQQSVKAYVDAEIAGVGGGGFSYEFIKLSSSGVSSITSTPSVIQWSNIEASSTGLQSIEWSSTTPNEVSCVSTGIYKIGGYILTHATTAARAQCVFEIYVNNIATGDQRGANYIRNSGTSYDYWTNEISSEPFSMVAGDTFELYMGVVEGAVYGYGGASTPEFAGENSRLWIERVA